jgi:hypothetical protein
MLSEIKVATIAIRTRDLVDVRGGIQAHVHLPEGEWALECVQLHGAMDEWFTWCGGAQGGSIHRGPCRVPFMFYNKSGERRRLEFTAVFREVVIQ